MTKIIVGVDGSPDADAALRWAIEEARLREADLTAVFAWTPDDVALEQLDDGEEQVHRDEEIAAERVLRAAVERALPADASVSVTQQVVRGEAVQVLLKAARDADLLVVGHRGAGPLRRLLTGSVALSCLHRIHGPMVVVRSPANGRAEGEAGAGVGTGAAAGGVRRGGGVLVGVDGSPESVEALRWAARAAELRKTSLTVVHAWLPPVTAGYYAGVDMTIMEKAARALLDECLQEALSDAPPSLPVRDELMLGGPAHTLIEASRGKDLLVTGARGRGGFAGLRLGSTSDQCVNHAYCPIAIIRGTGRNA